MARASALIGLFVVSMMFVGCGGGAPSVKVLGLGETTQADASNRLAVLVEVMNPSQSEMVLSRLEYELRFASWFDVHGSVPLSRSVQPGSSAIFEIPVQATRRDRKAAAEMSYVLKGRLFAVDQRLERSWKVFASGKLGGAPQASGPAVRVVAIR